MGKPLGVKKAVMQVESVTRQGKAFHVHLYRYRDEPARKAIKILLRKGAIKELKGRRTKTDRYYVTAENRRPSE